MFCFDKASASAGARGAGVDFDSGGGWWEVVALQKLVLAHNRLTSVSGSLSTLEGLTLLDLSHNRFLQVRLHQRTKGTTQGAPCAMCCLSGRSKSN